MKKLLFLVLVGLLLLGCLGSIQEAKAGDTVTVDYTGYYENTTIFDTTIKADAESAGIEQQLFKPLEFRVGSGQVIPGFEGAVIGMKQGEEKLVRLEPEEAYGQRREDLIHEFNLSLFEGDVQVGSRISTPNGAQGVVVSILNESQYNEQTATVDFNPQLAGQVLIFKIKLLSIK